MDSGMVQDPPFLFVIFPFKVNGFIVYTQFSYLFLIIIIYDTEVPILTDLKSSIYKQESKNEKEISYYYDCTCIDQHILRLIDNAGQCLK